MDYDLRQDVPQGALAAVAVLAFWVLLASAAFWWLR